jgi:hypothetical protein
LAKNEPSGLAAGITGIFADALADTYNDGLRMSLINPSLAQPYTGASLYKFDAGAKVMQDCLANQERFVHDNEHGEG